MATAKLFVKEGAYVFITGRRQKELDEAVKTIGTNVTGIQGDVARFADLDRLYEAVKTKGRIDVVFANAGVAEFAPMGKITELPSRAMRGPLQLCVNFNDLQGQMVVMPITLIVINSHSDSGRIRCANLELNLKAIEFACGIDRRAA